MRAIRNYIGGTSSTVWGFDDVNPVDGSVVAKVHEADAALVDGRSAPRGPRWTARTAAARSPIGSSGCAAPRMSSSDASTSCWRWRSPTREDPRPSPAPGRSPGGEQLPVLRRHRVRRRYVLLHHGSGRWPQRAELRGAQAVGGGCSDRAVEPAPAPADWKLAPAIACGNAVVVQPSEETPGSATLLPEILEEAWVPAGVYNVVHGFGKDSAGQYLTEHPDIDG